MKKKERSDQNEKQPKWRKMLYTIANDIEATNKILQFFISIEILANALSKYIPALEILVDLASKYI